MTIKLVCAYKVPKRTGLNTGLQLITLQLMTDREPTKEQIVMYTYMDVVPCAGATCSMKKSVTATAAITYSKKPAAETKVCSASCRCHGNES